MLRVERYVGLIVRIVGLFLALVLAAMVAVTFAQVVLRYVFDAGFPWAEEFSRYCFVWIVFLGSAVAFHRGLHIGVDLITARFARPWRKAAAITTALLVAGFCGVIVVASLPVLRVNALQVSPALELQMSYVYAAIPIAMTMIALLALLQAAKILSGDDNALEGQHGAEP